MSWELIRRAELDLLEKLENWMNSSEEKRQEMVEEIEKAMKTVDECYRIVQEYPVPEDFYWSQMNSLAPKTEAKLGILQTLFLEWKNGKKIDVKREFEKKIKDWEEAEREIERIMEKEEELANKGYEVGENAKS